MKPTKSAILEEMKGANPDEYFVKTIKRSSEYELTLYTAKAEDYVHWVSKLFNLRQTTAFMQFPVIYRVTEKINFLPIY